jgi:hypothetical protein
MTIGLQYIVDSFNEVLTSDDIDIMTAFQQKIKATIDIPTGHTTYLKQNNNIRDNSTHSKIQLFETTQRHGIDQSNKPLSFNNVYNYIQKNRRFDINHTNSIPYIFPRQKRKRNNSIGSNTYKQNHRKIVYLFFLEKDDVTPYLHNKYLRDNYIKILKCIKEITLDRFAAIINANYEEDIISSINLFKNNTPPGTDINTLCESILKTV